PLHTLSLHDALPISLVLSTEQLARDLRNEPVIREQLEGIRSCTLALFSPGTLNEDSHVIKCGALSLEELAELKKLGAAGVIAGQDRKSTRLNSSHVK